MGLQPYVLQACGVSAVQLVQWDELGEIDRLGLDQRREKFAGVDVPFISLPVGPGEASV